MEFNDIQPVWTSSASIALASSSAATAVAATALRRTARRVAITAGLETISLLSRMKLLAAVDAKSRAVIFTLHHVRPALRRAFEPNGHLSVTPEFLDAALDAVKSLGFEPAALDDIPQHLASGDSRRLFAVTLDDGNRNNAEHGAAIFARHGVPYTIFVTKGFSERTATMWWETVAALLRGQDSIAFDFGNGREDLPARTVGQKRHAFNRFCGFVDAVFEDEAVARINAAARAAGIDPMTIVNREIMTPEEIAALAARDSLVSFGAHSVTHCDLARAAPDRLAREVKDSIDAVTAWTGRRPMSFAYPYGFARVFGSREQRAVADAGIRLAVTTRPGVLTADHAGSLMALPRISLNGYYQKSRYVRALVSGAAFRFMG
jgi:peptidoglycan/xylan/chitin deacetylase (PgdA/CDA1 family)